MADENGVPWHSTTGGPEPVRCHATSRPRQARRSAGLAPLIPRLRRCGSCRQCRRRIHRRGSARRRCSRRRRSSIWREWLRQSGPDRPGRVERRPGERMDREVSMLRHPAPRTPRRRRAPARLRACRTSSSSSASSPGQATPSPSAMASWSATGRPVSEPYARRCTDDICEMPEAITVPKGAWFLAGDFRGESDDSRFWGPVPTRAITGSSGSATGRRSAWDGCEEDLYAGRRGEIGSRPTPIGGRHGRRGPRRLRRR